MKTTLPAVLDGTPTFESPVEVIRPALPDVEITTERIAGVLRSGRLSNDSTCVRRFEEQLSEWLGVRHAIAMCNGTLTLVLALKALGLRGKVIVPSFTFCATVHAVVWAGLEPVFADIDPQTLNITPGTAESVLSEDVSAVMPVHVFGSPCDIEGFEDLSRRHRLRLVFDSAQAIGSRYKGRKLGGYGDAESFSVHATKLLPTGEGGFIATDNDDLAEYLRHARNFGLDGYSDCTTIGLNAKMCEFPAVLGLLGLADLDEALKRRKSLVDRYMRGLTELPGLRFQMHRPDSETNHQNFVVLVDEEQFGLSRDDLMEALKAENIMCRRYFSPAIHLTTAYSNPLRHRSSLPVTESVAERCLCLPLFSDMADDAVDRISGAIRSIKDHSHEVHLALTGSPRPVALHVPTIAHPELKEKVGVNTFSRPAKHDLCIALPSRPRGLYEEMGKMLLDVLSDSPYQATLVGDGDRRAMDADMLLMIGDCMEFENYAALLGGLKSRKPVTALWLLDTLPPARLNDKAARIGRRLGMFNQAHRILATYLKPVRDAIPIGIRRKLGLSICASLLHGVGKVMNEQSLEELRKLDMNSQYEVFGRYEWINRNYHQGWLDRIFANTMPKLEFLSNMDVPATFVPLGYHPGMGRHLKIERDIDVLFIGELEYGRRKNIVEYVQNELQSRGRSVTVIGSGCYGEQRIEMMNRAKISLNVPRFPWDIPTIRVFLSIGCGSMVISEQMGDTAPFESGRHLVQAGVTDLRTLICHYLDHDDEREQIVENAFNLIHNELTMQRSLTRLLESTLGEQRPAA